MRYRELSPPAALRPLVHRVWLLQGPAGSGVAEFQRAMPDGRPELIFNLADRFERRGPAGPEPQPGELLVGATTRAIELRPTGRLDLLGLRLQPAAAPALLGIPGRELVDRTLDLRDVAIAWLKDLSDRLAGLGETRDRLDLLQGHLLRAAERAPRDRRVEAGIGMVLRSPGSVRVGGIAAKVGLSPRQLSRICRERVGMGPKLLGRLARFQRVLRELEQGQRVRWARLADRHGYFDQAHLARDFRRFAGIRPGVYLAAARELTRNFVATGEPD